MVEDGGFRRAGRLPVVMDSDCVEELGSDGGVEAGRSFLDQPQAEVDVPEEAALLRLAERWPSAELDRAPHVVEQGCAEQQVVAQAWVELGGLAAQRRDADRVLEQPSGIPVMAVGAGGRKCAEQRRDLAREEDARCGRCELAVTDLTDEELEKSLQLVCVPPHRRGQAGRIGLGGGLDHAHLHLEPAAEPLHAAEHAHGVTFGEAPVEQLDVVPDPRIDAPARIDELEREVGSAVLVRRRSFRPTA